MRRGEINTVKATLEYRHQEKKLLKKDLKALEVEEWREIV